MDKTVRLEGGTPSLRPKKKRSVYFLECDGRIKIGKTSGSVERRVANLQTGSALKISILCVLEDVDSSCEGQLHRRFDAQRISGGEWFDGNSEALRGFIARILAEKKL